MQILTAEVIEMSSRLPQGFQMALARNEAAMKAFANMTDYEKNSVIQWARGVQSRQEMQQLVDNIGGGQGIHS